MPDAYHSEVGVPAVVAWLLDGAPTVHTPQDVLLELCQRLVEADVAIDRAGVFVTTLHPTIDGRRFLWRRGEPEVLVSESKTGLRRTELYLFSPIERVVTTGEEIRRQPKASGNDFPILDELWAEGVTDYLVQPLNFTNGERHSATWATKRPGGFSAFDMAALDAVRLPLTRLAEIYGLRRIATNLLSTYVGHGTGERILRGQIHLGDIERIRAVILSADMRGFTTLADTLPGETVIALLNRYFDSLVPPIEAAGGEVLKYVGDGLLAIFPTTADEPATRATCDRALAAAEATCAALAAAEGEPRLRQGVALELGEVQYGNIGASARLDFTAIGPSVNLVVRLCALAGELGRDIVTSADFAARCSAPLQSLGRYQLKHIAEPREVFAPAPG